MEIHRAMAYILEPMKRQAFIEQILVEILECIIDILLKRNQVEGIVPQIELGKIPRLTVGQKTGMCHVEVGNLEGELPQIPSAMLQIGLIQSLTLGNLGGCLGTGTPIVDVIGANVFESKELQVSQHGCFGDREWQVDLLVPHIVENILKSISVAINKDSSVWINAPGLGNQAMKQCIGKGFNERSRYLVDSPPNIQLDRLERRCVLLVAHRNLAACRCHVV